MNEHDVIALKAKAWDMLMASSKDTDTAVMDAWTWLRESLNDETYLRDEDES